MEHNITCIECGKGADREHDGFYYCEHDYADMVAEDPALLEAQLDMSDYCDLV